jgi:uncharacterized iron-regulated protein
MMAKNTTGSVNSETNSNEDTIKLLKQLGELKKSGIITEEEFASKKQELLEKLK